MEELAWCATLKLGVLVKAWVGASLWWEAEAITEIVWQAVMTVADGACRPQEAAQATFVSSSKSFPSRAKMVLNHVT